MATGWTNEETFKFIELYQSCPEIWDPRHKYHKDKNRVNDAWVRIADDMSVPTTELKKKKDTLMAAFRTNHKKVVASQKSGAGENDVFKPIWIFYDALAAFMTNVYECKSILATEDRAEVREDADDLNEQPSQVPEETQSTSQGVPVRKRRCKNPPELEETSAQMKTALSTLKETLAAKKNKTEEDDCDLYGRLLAKALREFSEIDRLELRHEIDGLLIKKKRLLNNRRFVQSPSQIIISSNRPSPPSYTSSPSYNTNFVYEVSSPPNVSRLVASPPSVSTLGAEASQQYNLINFENQSDILQTACFNAMIEDNSSGQ